MISPRASILFLHLIGTLLPVATRANDFEAGGAGAALAPVAASRIRLLTERVVLTQGTGEKWGAEAVYVFHNPTAGPIATTFAFPEDATCTGEEESTDSSRDPSFHDLETWVRGVKVPVRTLDQVDGSPNELCLGRLHAFDLTLAPDERVEVRHRYRFSAGGGIGIPAEVIYVTHTGALWNGPIGLAEFVVAPRSAAWGLRWPAEYRFAAFEEQIGTVGGDRSVLYRFEGDALLDEQDRAYLAAIAAAQARHQGALTDPR